MLPGVVLTFANSSPNLIIVLGACSVNSDLKKIQTAVVCANVFNQIPHALHLCVQCTAKPMKKTEMVVTYVNVPNPSQLALRSCV